MSERTRGSYFSIGETKILFFAAALHAMFQLKDSFLGPGNM